MWGSNRLVLVLLFSTLFPNSFANYLGGKERELVAKKFVSLMSCDC